MGKQRLVSSGRLADELGIATRTVSYWVEQGWLVPTFTTPGGQYRWDMDDVYRQVRELREKKAGEADS